MSTASGPDLVVRGATVIDGTGAPPVEADVAGERATGSVRSAPGSRPGSRETRRPGPRARAGLHRHPHPLRRAALLGRPGLAEPPCTASPPCASGNCSLSLAPVRAGDSDRRMVGMFQTIEDIREETFDGRRALGAGRRFPEYLRLPRAVGIGVNVVAAGGALGAAPLRDGGGLAAANGDPLGASTPCARSWREARRSRGPRALALVPRRGRDLRPVPSRWADLDERMALARAARDAGASVIEAVPDARSARGVETCIRELGRISLETGILCTLQPVIHVPRQPDLWRRSLGVARGGGARRRARLRPEPAGPDGHQPATRRDLLHLLPPADLGRDHEPPAPASARRSSPTPGGARRWCAEGDSELSIFLPHVRVG